MVQTPIEKRVNCLCSNREDKNKMQTWLIKLQNDLSAADITNEKLADLFDVSASSVSRKLKGQVQMSFSFLVKLLNHLYDRYNIQRDIIKEYLPQAKVESLKEAAEYLAVRGEFEMLNDMLKKESEKFDLEIEKVKSNKKKVQYLFKCKEWIDVYEIICKKSLEKEVDLTEIEDLLEEKQEEVTSKEMQILIEILICQISYQQRDYKSLFKKMTKLEKRVNKLPNEFLANSFKARLKEGAGIVYLMDDQIEQARNSANSLLVLCETNKEFVLQKSNAHCTLAESYIFSDYEISKLNFEKSLELLHTLSNNEAKRKIHRIQATLNFLKIYHNRDLDTLMGVLDKEEQAFLEIRRGNNEEAIRILKEIEIENNGLGEFSTFYLGLAKNDITLVIKSLELFLLNGNKFFSRLPKKYLGMI